MNPMLEVAAAVALLAIIAGGAYLKGAKDARLEAEAAQLEAVQRAIRQASEQAAIDAEILRAAGERQQALETRTRTLIKTVVKHVEKPVYRDCRLDACGLCIARAAADGADGAACPCAADAPLPAAGAAHGREHGGTAGGVHRNSHAPALVP